LSWISVIAHPGQPASSVVEPLIHRLDLFFSVGWKQVIDRHIRRGYQDRLGMRKRIIAIFPVIMSDAGRSHSSVRHGLNEHEDIGLIYGAPAERKRLQHAIDRLLILAEQVDSKRFRERLDLREYFPRSEYVRIGNIGPKISSSMILSDQEIG